MAIADVVRRNGAGASAGPKTETGGGKGVRELKNQRHLFLGRRAIAGCAVIDPDDRLVQQCLAGDRQAFDRLVLAYRARVYAPARLALSDPEDAQDVTQETFVRAFEALPRYQYRGQFRT